MDCFPTEIGNENITYFYYVELNVIMLNTFIQHCIGILASKTINKMNEWMNKDLKERTKTVIVHSMHVIVENPRESTVTVLEISDFGKFARYTLNMQKSTVFLCTGKNSEKK